MSNDSWILDTDTNYSIKLPSQEEFASSSERVYEFNISEISAPIAGITRKVIAINNNFPGPLIQAIEGDTVIVKLRNLMDSRETSLHFHGQAMNHTNYNDGVLGMTQCGIAPGEEFEYKFFAGPSGTFWYHSHAELQALQGFIGPMIVFSRTSEWKEQRVLLLSDFYDKSPDDLMDSYLEPWIGGGTEPVPGITLAQGSLTPEICIPHTNQVKLRVINAASFSAFRLQLGNPGLQFQVIEADGTALQPTPVDQLIIFPAQRYSILVELDHAEWLFSTPLKEFYDESDGNFEALNRTSATMRTLLRTKDEALLNIMPDSSSSEHIVSDTALIDQYFEPLENNLPPHDPTFTKYVDVTMTRTEDGSIAGAINGNVFNAEDWQYNLADLLDQKAELIPRHQRTHITHHSHDSSTSIEQRFPHALLQTNDWAVADFIIRNYDDGFHPMHLHGHDVWVMERGKLDNSTQPIHWEHPLRRDVVGVPQNEWVRIRVVLDNPGIWWFHCHIPWHSMTGMRTGIISQPQKLKSQSAPQKWWQLCAKSKEKKSS